MRACFQAHRSGIPNALPDTVGRGSANFRQPLLHDTRLRPPNVAVSGRTSEVALPSSAFPLEGGSSNFLVTGHLLEVGPLSRGAKLEPLSNPLQVGLRFLQHPLPAALSVCLTACFLIGLSMRELRAYYVPREYPMDGLGLASPPVVLSSAVAENVTTTPAHEPFGPSLSASLACSL